MRMVRRCSVAVALAAVLRATLLAVELPYEQPPINYLTSASDDPVGALAARLADRAKTLPRDPKFGYLPALLEALDVPVASQVLVFSKTSFQAHLISPKSPRAIYFNDDVYVGFVPGGTVFEISAADPRLGAVFYTFDGRPGDAPLLERKTHDCLQCHASPRTSDLPGHLVRSVFPDRRGMPLFNAGSFDVDHRTPFQQRWGGWYVTGTHGKQLHMGNQVVRDAKYPDQIVSEAGANVTDLSSRFDASAYLAPHSDIVALMVLEHQVQMHNRITRAGYEERMAAYYDQSLSKSLGRDPAYRSESFDRRCRRAAEDLLEYALFCGEAPLADPIQGTSGFAAQFAARGPRDAKGRSLRDFDLTKRLFRYPLSYLVYSAAMSRLPPTVKARFYKRLGAVLSGGDRDPKFAHLSVADRQSIREILLDTCPDYRNNNPP